MIFLCLAPDNTYALVRATTEPAATACARHRFENVVGRQPIVVHRISDVGQTVDVEIVE